MLEPPDRLSAHVPHPAVPGLSLRTPCFTSSKSWNPERVGALVLCCSDGRWGEACDEFCHQRLLIPRYDRWAVPGGPVCLLLGDSDDGFCRGVWEQLGFMVRAHQLRRFVLIAHYGCAYYADLLREAPDGCLPTQVEDLRLAADALREWFAGLSVEAYLAMRRGVTLSFHQVRA